MRVTEKGEVTIPQRVREKLGIDGGSEVDFLEDNGRIYLVKIDTKSSDRRFAKVRGIAKEGLSTDEVMKLTREF